MANVSPGKKGFARVPLEERFWAKVDKRGPDECWPWLGANDGRYGTIYVDGRQKRATRVSWEFANGEPFPAHLDACHTCDNTRCVNPAHIWPGTPSENAKDALAKGRIVPPKRRGKQPWTAKCRRGHDFSGENQRIRPDGKRVCRLCHRIAVKKWDDNNRARVRAAARAALTDQPHD